MSALPQPGEMFGRYEILRRIGRGGMGVVYAARQRGLDREVALKLLSPELSESEEYRRRFAREAAALGRLESPHIITVYEAGEHGDWVFIATQLVPDGDLAGWLGANGPLDPEKALDLLLQVAQGLADAHAAGILHRDIKPSNVLLRRRPDGSLHAYLCDLGIAFEEGSEHTKTSGVIGTLGYMAPERHLGEPAAASADIYALGCLLWALVTGAAPYKGTDFAVARAHLESPVPQLSDAFVGAFQINDLLTVTMAKHPSDRVGTVAELVIRIESIQRDVSATRPTVQAIDALPPMNALPDDQTLVRVPPECEPDAEVLKIDTVEASTARRPISTSGNESAVREEGRKRPALLALGALLAALSLVIGYLFFADGSKKDPFLPRGVLATVGSERVNAADVDLVANFTCVHQDQASSGAPLDPYPKSNGLRILIEASLIDQMPDGGEVRVDGASVKKTVDQLRSGIKSSSDPQRLTELITRSVATAERVQGIVQDKMAVRFGDRLNQLSAEEGLAEFEKFYKSVMAQLREQHPVRISKAFDTNQDGTITEDDKPEVKQGC